MTIMMQTSPYELNMEGLYASGRVPKATQRSPVFSWASPPEMLTLDSKEVHVWRAALDAKEADLRTLQRVLSADEQARARRFYFQKDREHFIVARGLLRVVLGRYLGTQPDQLRFSYTPHGKPALSEGNGLRFNVSHSHGLVLYAVTRGREIGVDIEHIRPQFASEEIAERFFSLREVSGLRALPAHEQIEAFFNCWTRKEAYIKARGEGLSLPLDQFDVSLAPGEPAELLFTRGNPREASRWSLRKLEPGAGYVAALAVEGHDWRLKCWGWQSK